MLVICVCQRLDWSECVKASGQTGASSFALCSECRNSRTVVSLVHVYLCCFLVRLLDPI